CGAAFTDDHAELLKRYTKRVAVLMDADDRGREIAAAAIAVLHRHGMQTSELLLPPGEDPDSLFRRIGKRAFRTIVAESQLTGHLQALKESTGVDLASLISDNPLQSPEADEADIISTMQSDRPRLMAREQELQHQMRKLGSKRFLFGQGPERMQINTELMKLRSQLSEVSKQLNRPVVWYK
ncbi:toprim domain-containing protein, partial [Macellibacteroides fermentans]|uniref:toprim domain-containing protein n=1 Tax=Macellibacteroides fermentans TaxID=879969 RepID=UPI00406C8947